MKELKKLTKEELSEIERFLDTNLDEFISSYVFKDERNIDQVLKSIQEEFKLKNYPYKIVCLYISHTS
jgi:excinuclease UvrABC nuclease subunit